jgi:hypothetical protein
MFRDPRQHLRTDFVLIVEGEHVVRESVTAQGAMGAALPLDPPAESKQRSENA